MTWLHLASRSPRRRELLASAGIPFRLLDVDVDESLRPGTSPEAAVLELAARKASAGAAVLHQGWVLGADTLVALGDDILGKPKNRDDAKAMLGRLSGSTHRVLTGICLLDSETGLARVACERTDVTMRFITAAEISDYVASGESDDKAGSYAIQERGDRFVTSLSGSYSNVVGLPLETVSRWIRELELER